MLTVTGEGFGACVQRAIVAWHLWLKACNELAAEACCCRCTGARVTGAALSWRLLASGLQSGSWHGLPERVDCACKQHLIAPLRCCKDALEHLALVFLKQT
jgi:hypothetical protein